MPHIALATSTVPGYQVRQAYFPIVLFKLDHTETRASLLA